MDDLEFRRKAYADPKNQDSDFLDKKNATEDDRYFVDDLQRFDEKLKNAMNVKPPEGLAERIILNQTLNDYSQSKQKSRNMLSMAASVLLILGLFFYIFRPLPDTYLENEIFAHVYEELVHLSEKQGKDISHLNNALAEHGGKIVGDIGEINYVGSCSIVKKKGVHLILSGTQGAVTVLLLPEITVSAERLISDDRFHGSIIPVGKGSIAIVGEKGESLTEIKKSLQNSFNWVI